VPADDISEDAIGEGAAGALLAGVVVFIVLLFIGALLDGATFVSCGVSVGAGVELCAKAETLTNKAAAPKRVDILDMIDLKNWFLS
jgi:hypothetical protein